MSRILTASKSMSDAVDYVLERTGDHHNEYVSLQVMYIYCYGEPQIKYHLFISAIGCKLHKSIEEDNLYELLKQFESVADDYVECRDRILSE